MSPRRWTPSWGALLAASALVLASCGGSANKPTPVAIRLPPPSVVATVPKTPTGSSASSVPTSDAPASTFAAKTIETPSDLIGATDGQALPADASVTPSDFAIAATAIVPKVEVYATATDGVAKTTLQNPLPDGKTPLTLLVEAQTRTRAKVLLPIAPNGSTGWVELGQLKIARVDYRIDVSLSKHELVVHHGADTLMTEKVGVGTPQTPTPLGHFYLKALLKPPNQNTVYGHYAYPLSGQSETLKEWKGGEPTLGLHGTNDPAASIGKDVSHGCIRMRNEAIDILAKILPLGTPLTVVA